MSQRKLDLISRSYLVPDTVQREIKSDTIRLSQCLPHREQPWQLSKALQSVMEPGPLFQADVQLAIVVEPLRFNRIAVVAADATEVAAAQ
jgi:hypothetical protein